MAYCPFFATSRALWTLIVDLSTWIQDTDCRSLYMDTGASRGFSFSVFTPFQLALKQIYLYSYCQLTSLLCLCTTWFSKLLDFHQF